ncbi:MAG: sulfatase-like hydrolase/transferase [Verrucomicrobiales bacterium]
MKRISIALIALILPIAACQAADTKPNVIFLFSDDQSHETIKAMGHIDIETPNLDKLASQGAIFTHSFNMGAWHGAICVASRTMLVTGRTVWRARALEKSLDQESKAGRLWPQRMAAQGYETYFSGKWHISTPPEKCFDHVVNKRPGMPPDVKVCYNRPISGKPDPWSPTDPQFGGFWEGGKHWSEVLGDDSIAFIENAAKSDKPFFMYLAFNAPHDPRQSPKEYVDRYPLDRIKVPADFLPEYPEKEAMGADKKLRDEALAPFPRDEHAVKTHRQEYYAIVTHMDTQVGRILDALEKSGKADNTWIIFTSDHGLACGHHGLMGKQNMYDHSLRVPFIVRGPGVKAGAKIDSPIHLQDAMATALDLAGADLKDIEFQSVRPMLAGGKGGLDAVYAAYMDKQRAVIDGGWKLILYPEAKVAKLFNLTEDPQELKNLAAESSLSDRKKALFAKLLELQARYDDRLDLKKTFPELQ